MVFCSIAKNTWRGKLSDEDREKKRFSVNDDLSKSLCEPRGGAATHVVTNTDNWIKAKKTFHFFQFHDLGAFLKKIQINFQLKNGAEREIEMAGIAHMVRSSSLIPQ